MKQIPRLFSYLILSFGISANAVADYYYDHPRNQDGREFDATTWEWDGKSPESTENTFVATFLCRQLGHDYASSWNIGKGQSQGTWRLHRNGQFEWCDFCRWYIKDLNCRRGRQ